jgi:hypothetical protein
MFLDKREILKLTDNNLQYILQHEIYIIKHDALKISSKITAGSFYVLDLTMGVLHSLTFNTVSLLIDTIIYDESL